MKNFLLLVAVTVLSLAVVYANPSQGADLFKAQVASTDAGSTAVATLNTQQYYSAQCNLPSCIHFDAGVADCSQDQIMTGRLDSTQTTPTVFEASFESAGVTGVRFKALDAGAVTCNVYTTTKNLNSLLR